MMEHIVQLGYDVNKFQHSLYRGFQGTPLHRAIRSRSVENVRLLLEKGADPCFNDSHNHLTALEEASGLATPEIRELLASYLH